MEYEIIRMWNENGGNGVISSFVHINLFVKMNGEWSEAIQGVGGSSFVTNEKTVSIHRMNASKWP